MKNQTSCGETIIVKQKQINPIKLILTTALLLHHLFVIAQWETLKQPEGIYVRSMQLFNNQLFLGGNAGGLYHSMDGSSWQLYEEPPFKDESVDPMVSNDNALFMHIVNDGLYKYVEGNLEKVLDERVQKLGVHDSLVFASTENQLLMSPDDGISWNPIERLSGKEIRAIASKGNDLYLATRDSLFLTSDLETWTKNKINTNDHIVMNMLVLNDSIYVGTFMDGLYKTDLQGSGWKRLEDESLNANGNIIQDMHYDGISLFVATRYGLFYTQNDGMTWAEIPYGDRPTTSRGFNHLIIRDNILYAGASDGLYSTELGTFSLAHDVDGLYNQNVNNIYIDDNEIIFSSRNQLFSGDPNLDALMPVSGTGGTIGSIETIGDYKFVGWGRGISVYASENNTWQYLSGVFSDTTVRQIKHFNDTLYAATEHGLFASLDSAESWLDLTSGFPAIDIEELIVNDTSIFIATNGLGVLTSKDRGTNWTSLDNEVLPDWINHIVFYHGNLIAGGNNSANAHSYNFQKKEWTTIAHSHSELPAPTDFMIYEDQLITSTNSGVFLFDETQIKWTNIGQGLVSNDIQSLAPGSDGILGSSRGYGLVKLPYTFFNSLEAPVNLEVTNVEAESALISWTSIDHSVNYRVSVSSDNFNTMLVDQAYTNKNELLVEGLNKTTAYQVNVLAENYADTSQVSVTVSFTTLDAIPLPPSALTAVQSSATSITLEWTDNSDNEESFVIEKYVEGISGYTMEATLDPNTTSYVALGVETNGTYTFRVKSKNLIGASPYAQSADTVVVRSQPLAPTDLLATAQTLSSIMLVWTDNSAYENEFVIERSDSNSDFTALATVGQNQTSYFDQNLRSSVYTYRIVARNGAGDSGFSNEASADLTITRPLSPSNFYLTRTNPSEVQLQWTDNATNETGYVVHRAPAQTGFFEAIANLEANTNNYIDQSIEESVEYLYRVSAVNLAGTSNFAMASTILSVEDVPVNLLRIFPNPTSHTLFIDFGNLQYSEFDLEIIDITGHTLIAGEAKLTLDLSALSSGTYLLKVKSTNRVELVRFLKQ